MVLPLTSEQYLSISQVGHKLLLDQSIAVGLHALSKSLFGSFQNEAVGGVILGLNCLSTFAPREFLFGFQLPSRDRQTRATGG